MAVALGLIIAIILLKYKPTYKVTLAGKELGYVKNGTELDQRIQEEIIEMEGKSIDFVSLDEMPNYELKLVNRTQETNEDEEFCDAIVEMEIAIDLLKAFATGGIICLIGQIFIDLTKLTPGRILVAFVVLGVALTAMGLYEPLVEWAGAGATVPLTGFGYTMAKGGEKAIAEQGARGILTGAFTAASGGITAAIICGIIASLITRPKEK